MKKLLAILAVGAIALFSVNKAEAAVVQFGPSDWVDESTDPINISTTATLSDDGLGNVLVEIAVSGLSIVTGDILRIAFEGLSFTSVSDASTNTGDDVSILCNDCGGGSTGFTGGLFNQPPYNSFDTIVEIGGTGANTGNNTLVSFLAEGVSALDAMAVALRVQNTNTAEGSLKLINESPSEVPLPAAGFLLIAGLGALGLMRRRKTA